MEMLTPASASKIYNVSPQFLKKLEREKRIKLYTVEGHPKIKRYKRSELEKQFVPL